MKFRVARRRRVSSASLPGRGKRLVAWLASAALAVQGTHLFAQTNLLTQPSNALPSLDSASNVTANGQMFLQADRLVYDFDRDTVTAIGHVEMYYQGYALDADRVVYDQKSGRLTASGGVRMLEPGGNLVTTETLDITDDFRDGFIGSLNLITTQGTRFTAQTAERRDGNLTIFRKGVYTACEPCLTHPERPPLWQLKAARIIHDKEARTVYYENARLEFFGIPIAYMPVFFHPDPTVKRKSGFLVPSLLQSDAIGVGVTTPYFWNLAPNYDVTFSPTVLSRQGLLMQTRWRHRMMNGSYSIRLAGIFQNDPGAFVNDGRALSGDRDWRGSVSTHGVFSLSDRWSAGWDLDLSTDRTFNRDYKIPDALGTDLVSQMYLVGLGERNYFSANSYYFRVQREDTSEDLPDDGNPATDDVYLHDDQAEQAFVHPVVDHNYIVDSPIFGGELRLDSNLASLTREESDIRHPPAPYGAYYSGVAGTFTRATSRASWKRRLILPGGQLVTPFSYLQADADWVEPFDEAAGLTDTNLVGRVMPAVGVEYELPILATLGPTTHTFGPKAQIIARPNEIRTGDLPNEDSQSLEFDDTTLFKWDKFAGYDRQEGGTRANLGLVYQGLFPRGASVDALVGRSFQLAGENSFALKDHVLTGVGTGLETDDSDYIARVTVNTGLGLATTARSRFDDEDFTLNRLELSATGGYGNSSAGIDYTYLRESPSSGIFNPREEIAGSAAIEFVDNWSVLGSLVYDVRNGSLVSDSVGLAYADECFTFSATYSETTEAYTDIVSSRQIYFRVSLRTVAEGGYGRSLPVATDVQ